MTFFTDVGSLCFKMKLTSKFIYKPHEKTMKYRYKFYSLDTKITTNNDEIQFKFHSKSNTFIIKCLVIIRAQIYIPTVKPRLTVS